MTPISSTRNATRTVLLTLAVVALAARGTVVADDRDDRRGETKVYELDPRTWTYGNPEGIAFDKDSGAFFVGATGAGAAAGGAIYRGTLGKRSVTEFIPGAPGKEAAGMKVARGRLYVAGGFSGTVSVYDIATRQPVALFESFGAGMLNDLVVTKHGDVFVTDSQLAVLWHVTAAQVAAGGGPPHPPQRISVEPEIKPDIAYYPFSSGLNGIVALKGGRSLIVVQSHTGKLFRIDLDEDAPYGRTIHRIALELFVNGDGLLIDGGDLIVVHGPPATVSVVRLNGKADRGKVIERRTDPSFREPSTIARARNFYLIVNADFTNSVTPFTVTGLPRNHDDDDE